MADWVCRLCPATGSVSGWGSPEAARDAAMAELQRHYGKEHQQA